MTDWEKIHSAPENRAVPLPKQLRILWRVERRKNFHCQIITAAIYQHPLGQAVPDGGEMRQVAGRQMWEALGLPARWPLHIEERSN